MYLTTTGARSGRHRTVPLVAVLVRDQIVVIGSNWGSGRHPGWVHNLAADPRATLTHAGRTASVRAVELTGAEAEAAWQMAGSLYRGYRTHPARAGDRTIRVFRLDPT